MNAKSFLGDVTRILQPDFIMGEVWDLRHSKIIGISAWIYLGDLESEGIYGNPHNPPPPTPCVLIIDTHNSIFCLFYLWESQVFVLKYVKLRLIIKKYGQYVHIECESKK